jgi:hypothetical protein
MITFKDKGFGFLFLKVNKRTTFEQYYRVGIHFLIVHMSLTSCMVAIMSIYCKKEKRFLSSKFKRKFSMNVSQL